MSAIFSLFNGLLDFLGRGLAFFYDLIPSYGIAIILLTVAVRLVLLPLTIKQTRSMQEMQKLQPEIKRLQAKYKGGDRQKLNEEMMKLYKEHKVNPLGGCLPLVLQLPIFLALYRVFAGCGQVVAKGKSCAQNFVGVKYLPKTSAMAKAIKAGKAGFLGMDLGLAPVAALKAHGIVRALPYFVLVFAMVLTTWYQQKQISAMSTGQQAQQMQMMGKIMPVLLGVFSLNLPAGVSIYWVASNLWTIGQQRLLLGKTPAPAAQAAQEGPSDAPATGGWRSLLKPRPEDKPQDKPAAKPKPQPGKPQQGPQRGKPQQKGQQPQAGGTKPAGSKPGGTKPSRPAGPGPANGGPGNGKPKPAPAAGKANGKGDEKAAPQSPESKQPVASTRPRSSNARKRRRR